MGLLSAFVSTYYRRHLPLYRQQSLLLKKVVSEMLEATSNLAQAMSIVPTMLNTQAGLVGL